MEFGLREALIGVGFLVIAAILFDGWRRMRSAKQGELGMSTELGGSCDDDWEYYRGELPNGGARKVTLRNEPALDDAEEPQTYTRAVKAPIGRRAQQSRDAATDADGMSGQDLVREVDFDEAELGDFDMDRADGVEGVGKARPVKQSVTDPLFDDDDALLRARAEQERKIQQHSRDRDHQRDYHRGKDSRNDAASHASSSTNESTGKQRAGGKSSNLNQSTTPDSEADLKLDVQSVQDVIVVNVMARHGDEFAGADLQRVLQSCGFHHGDMNIYHRYEQHNGKGGLLFSVANVIEPGTFDPDAMDEFYTPGVCMFMKLPGPKRAVSAFDVMIDSARKIASHLGGEMKDENHCVMTQQTIEHYRQRVLDFERKMLSLRAVHR